MKIRLSVLLGLIYIFINVGCSAEHVDEGSIQSFSSDPALEAKAMNVLRQKCSSCHGSASFGGVTNITKVSVLISTGLVVPGDATKGRLVGSIEDSSMPVSGNVSAIELNDIKSWINNGLKGNVGGGEIVPPVAVEPPPVFTGSPLQVSALNILNTNCVGCHGEIGSGGVSRITDVKGLLATGLIVDKDASQGRLLASIREGSMPPSGPLGASDLQTLEDWVNQGVGANVEVNLPQVKLEPTFSSISQLILQPKCTACHGSVKAVDGIRLDSYDRVFAKAEMVKLGNPQESKLYKSVHSGEMPPRSDGYQPLTGEEQSAIYTWIQNGALNN
ncbi:MAG: hypothetical protein KDD50_10645 [Bdellovibrionales bacterium]|nr:hypothetical protein [Bdellovibrionales bacterium]